VQERRKNLHAVRKFRKESGKSQSALNTIPLDDIRRRDMELFPPSDRASRIRALSDGELHEQALDARDWLLAVLDYHEVILDREHELRLLYSAVTRVMNGREGSWSDMERLYMMLTDPALASPGIRLRSTFVLILHLNYAERLKHVGELSARRLREIQHAKQVEEDLHKTQERISEIVELMKIDHFACAVPLSSLTQSSATSVVDDNAGCCPICQNSYTDLSAFTVEDLLADYPVRLKQCGHIVGRGCLEKWMATPKIDEAKHPHRTCPLCRMQIEGTAAPQKPWMLERHLQTNGRAIVTKQQLLYRYDIEPEECLDAVVACMSMGIACDELLAEVRRQKGRGDKARSEASEKILAERREAVEQQMRVWGFRGTAAWSDIRAEWMNSGITRKE